MNHPPLGFKTCSPSPKHCHVVGENLGENIIKSVLLISSQIISYLPFQMNYSHKDVSDCCINLGPLYSALLTIKPKAMSVIRAFMEKNG